MFTGSNLHFILSLMAALYAWHKERQELKLISDRDGDFKVEMRRFKKDVIHNHMYNIETI
jgi:hypothetical protein